MPSFIVLILSVFVVAIMAQNYTFPSGFNIGLVSSTEKASWCQGERNTCPQICGGAASPNDCESDTLTFHCVCINGTVPNVALYQNTIPFYVCNSNYGQCIKNNPSDVDAQRQCKNGLASCGTLNASASIASTTTSTSATTLTTGTTSATATTTSAAASAATSKAAAMALQAAQDHSTGLLVAALLAAVRILL
ncbi:hypothetical protein Egran_05627 [Elaphomyces granulatus]|uniref:DUF7707 domain-containing protein n=1 Tax=Elaphomyces granulatus TaxID=519963 RepID=A0A232LR18_9EURO|nr:hypothetical protein Egran_05627 [Elaphomyces granulatus]